MAYEYMSVISFLETNLGEVRFSPPDKAPRVWYVYKWELWWPNSTKAEHRSTQTNLPTLFTELGRDGWKLVASNILDSAIHSTDYGWPEAGTPLRERWIFMREVNS
jgi:hypothetical protein